MPMDQLNRLNLGRYTDGPDALPRGTARRHRPGTQVNFFGDLADAVRDSELYRIRTFPHLYDEREVSLAHEMRELQIAHVEGFDWDCHTCKMAVITAGPSDPCPSGRHK